MRITDSVSRDPAKSGIAKVIQWSVNNQLLVIIGMLALLVTGWTTIKTMPLMSHLQCGIIMVNFVIMLVCPKQKKVP